MTFPQTPFVFDGAELSAQQLLRTEPERFRNLYSRCRGVIFPPVDEDFGRRSVTLSRRDTGHGPCR